MAQGNLAIAEMANGRENVCLCAPAPGGNDDGIIGGHKSESKQRKKNGECLFGRLKCANAKICYYFEGISLPASKNITNIFAVVFHFPKLAFSFDDDASPSIASNYVNFHCQIVGTSAAPNHTGKGTSIGTSCMHIPNGTIPVGYNAGLLMLTLVFRTCLLK